MERQLSSRQAMLLCESFCLSETLENEEEVFLLQQGNPELLKAMRILQSIADQD